MFYASKLLLIIFIFPVSLILTIVGPLGIYLNICLLQLLIFFILQKQIRKVSANSFTLTDKKIFRLIKREAFVLSIIGTIAVMVPILVLIYAQKALNTVLIVVLIMILFLIQLARVFGVFIVTSMFSISHAITHGPLYRDLTNQEYRGDQKIVYRLAGFGQIVLILAIPQIFNFILKFPIVVEPSVFTVNLFWKIGILLIELFVYVLIYFIYENGLKTNTLLPIMNPSFVKHIQFIVTDESRSKEPEEKTVVTTRTFISDFLRYYPEFLIIILIFLLSLLFMLYFVLGSFTQIFHKSRLDNRTDFEVTGIIGMIIVFGHFIVLAFLFLGSYTERFFLYYKIAEYKVKNQFSRFSLPVFFILIIFAIIVFLVPSPENLSYFVVLAMDTLSLVAIMFAAFTSGQNINSLDSVIRPIKTSFLPGFVVVGLILVSFYNMADFFLLIPDENTTTAYIINFHDVLEILVHRIIVIVFSLIVTIWGYVKTQKFEDEILQNKKSLILPFSFKIVLLITFTDVLLTKTESVRADKTTIILRGKSSLEKINYVLFFLFDREYEELKAEYEFLKPGVLKRIFQYDPILCLGISRLLQKAWKK